MTPLVWDSPFQKRVNLRQRAYAFGYSETTWSDEEEDGRRGWLRPDKTTALLSDEELEKEIQSVWWADAASKWVGA